MKKVSASKAVDVEVTELREQAEGVERVFEALHGDWESK